LIAREVDLGRLVHVLAVFTRNEQRLRRERGSASETVPLFERDLAIEDRRDLAQHQAQLRHGVLLVRRHRESVMLMDEKSVPRAGIGTFESELPELA
jgi:hypothetical protein